MNPFRRTPYDREILRLAIPALGALAAEPLYVLSDTAVVGHIGTAQLGGLAVASSILLSGYSLFIFLAYGTTATVARLLGAGDEREAAHQAVQGVWLAFGIGIVLTVAGLVFAGPLVDLLGATGEVRTNALVYLRISLFGVPAMLMVFAGTGYLRGLQNMRTPLVVSLVSAVFNLVFELVLIFVLGFGIGASAFSTVIAQWGSAIVYVIWVRRAVRHHQVAVRPDARTLRKLSVVGRDLFIRTAALRAAFLVATAVATRIGPADVAAHQIAMEIWMFLALVLDAIAIAGQAIVGRLLGAEATTDARAASRRMIEWGTLAGVVLGAIVFALRDVLPNIFSGDPLVRDLAAFVLIFVALMQPLNGAVFALDGLLIGAGDMRFLAVAMVVATIVFVPCAWLVLFYDGGLGWLWASLWLFMAVRWLTLTGRFLTERWAVPGAERLR